MEASVGRTLTRLDFEHAIFKIRRKLVWRGRFIERTLPIFRGYVFVRACNCWDSILDIIGVIDFVKFGGVLENVPSRVVEDLRAQSDENNVLRWSLDDEAVSMFNAGDEVSVTYAGQMLRGIFQRSVNSDRAIILLDIMGRMAPVTVKEADLVLVKKRNRPPRHLRKIA